MSVEIRTKAVVSVTEMARMVGLSRARFYQLQGTKFPKPVYDVVTGRPVYTEDMQTLCLSVRQRNFGIDGKPVLFYARRSGASVSMPKPRRKPIATKKSEYAEIVESVRALGLTSVTAAQVEAAVSARYKNGLDGVEQGEIIRAIFLDLQRQNSANNVQR
jgi:hypothetical protein